MFKAKRRAVLKNTWKVVVILVIISMIGFYMRVLYTLTLGKEKTAPDPQTPKSIQLQTQDGKTINVPVEKIPRK